MPSFARWIGPALVVALLARCAVPASGADGCEPQVVAFPSEKLSLTGWLWKPAGNGPFPACVWNHGGEKAQRPSPELAKTWVDKGFVLFCPVRRGHSPSPGDHVQALIDRMPSSPARDKRAAEVVDAETKDVLAAQAWLETQPFVDAKHLVVSGVASGGALAVLLAEKGDGFRAAVAFAPGAATWKLEPGLVTRLQQATRDRRIPLFLLQASNDADLSPTTDLGGRAGTSLSAFKAKAYPVGPPKDAKEGREGFALDGALVWGEDVFSFLRLALLDGPKALDPRGRPDASFAGGGPRYDVWVDQDGWHLSLVSPGAEEPFQGSLRVADGAFEGVTQAVPGVDLAKEGEPFAVSDRSRTIAFDIVISGECSVGFKVRGEGATVHFALGSGKPGAPLPPARVFVGRNGAHPEKTAFELPAAAPEDK